LILLNRDNDGNLVALVIGYELRFHDLVSVIYKNT
jgi:hypothetical protein